VREAIGQLVSEGLIERIPGRGIMVARTERNDIVDLYELREALEVYTVGKVAQSQFDGPQMSVLRGLSENVRTLAEELMRSGQERLDERQMQRFVAADMGFHTLLIQAAGNARIAKVVSETHVLTRIFSYRREGHDAQLLGRIYRYHVAILDAIEKGNITEAKETLREHLRASLQERLDTYDRWERQHEMNRLMRLPSQILEELDRMRFGGQGGKNTGQRHQRRTGKR
jgi:DNA-binding GntR family transcriptional regulator